MTLDITIDVQGGLLRQNIDAVVRRAGVQQVLRKIDERMNRQGRGLGARRNVVVKTIYTSEGVFVMRSTLRHPRRSGTAWKRKSYRIVQAMAPNVVRKWAREAVQGIRR